jgi:uncharacterized protein
MRLLIDGYNLLFASEVFASAAGPPTLHRTRIAFLEFLAGSIEEKVRAGTTIVFDATQAPAGLSHELSFAGMRILFSRNPSDADALLEDLLEAEKSPREVMVVSSDHRVQRAARRCGAKYIDSEEWIRKLRQCRPSADSGSASKKPEEWEQSAELAVWLNEFADVDSRQLLRESHPLPERKVKAPSSEEAVKPPGKPKPAKPPRARPPKKKKKPPNEEKPSGIWNPFPPGYGEDIEK